jgi:glycosyltransferase involved in cell wall biosynthesis
MMMKINQRRILVVTPFYKPAYVYGGPTRSIPALCEGWVSLGVEVTVYTTNANGAVNLPVSTEQGYEINGVTVQYFQRRLRGNYFYSPDLAQACHIGVKQFDLVYIASNWGYPFIPVCRAAIHSGIPFVITPRTSFMRETWKGKYLKKLAYHRLFERSLITRAVAIHYTTTFEVTESVWLGLNVPFFVVPNPVDIEEFSQLPETGGFRNKYSIERDAKIILFLGRIEVRKGIDLTLRAFSSVKNEFPDARLVLAGPEEDGYLDTVMRMANSLGVLDRLTVTGFLNAWQRLEAIVDADIFILTSYSENFGMALVEAMAGGLPVLISDRVGIGDDVSDTGAGIVAPLNPDAIARGLAYMLSCPEQRRTMGQQGKQAAQKYQPRKVAELMLTELEPFIDRKL